MAKSAMLDPRWRLLARLRAYCDAMFIASIGLGCVVLSGHTFKLKFVESVLPGLLEIRESTALSLILLGISLGLLLPDPPRRLYRTVGLVAGALTASVGGISLLFRIGGVSTFSDNIFNRVYQGAISTTSLPERMAPSTAIIFLSLGLALLMLDWTTTRGRRPSQCLALWGALLSTMTLCGYIYRAKAIYGIFSYTAGTAYSALTLLAISIAIFLARPRVGLAGDLTGRFMGSAMARRFLPAVIILPLVGGWIREQGQLAGLYGAELGIAVNTTVSVAVLCIMIWYSARKLNQTEASLEEVREAGNIHYDASLRDELTGLYNRRGFLTFAEEQIALACSGSRELLVVFADVDGLKGINDSFGHFEGDRALRKTAELLLAVFRDTDVVARLGGDEFAALALDCSTTGMVRIKAHIEKLLREINNRDNPWKLSISIGAIHVDSLHQLSITDLLSEADKVMYERKRSKYVPALR